MNVEISKQEAWKIIDAIKSYQKDYSLSVSVNKTLTVVVDKMKKVTT